MDRTQLVRLRWRLTGAWLWPSFLVLTLVDAVVIHALPPAGDSISGVGAWLLGSALMLLGMVLFSPLGAAVLRRGRRDMPKTVAKNYAGTFAILGVSLAFLIAGIVHQSVINGDHNALRDAESRAEAFIGDHAPPAFRQNVHHMTWLAVQAPQYYRICVANPADNRDYCVVVDRNQPFGSSVTYAGTTSNALLDQGAN